MKQGMPLSLACVIGAVLGTSADAPAASPSIVAAAYRPDTPFPQFRPQWMEAWATAAGNGEDLSAIEARIPRGGYLHLCLRSAPDRPIEIKDVLLDGVSLARSIAFAKEKVSGFLPASIHLGDLARQEADKLAVAGEPVWWKPDPFLVPPGGFAEVVIRLRRDPTVSALPVTIVADDARVDGRVEVLRPQPRFAGISFSPGLDRVYLYARHPRGDAAPVRILIDGADVTAGATIAADKDVATTPVEVRLPQPLLKGSFHLFQALYADGSSAASGIRAFADDLIYGMWGYTNNGDTPEERTRNCLNDFVDHNINVHMESIGKWEPFLSSDAGQDFLQSIGLRRMVKWPGNARHPAYYFLMDEPDAHDYAVNQLPAAQRLGSFGQALVEHGRAIRKRDASVPQLLNLDNTYTPDNYYTYAQLPDVVSCDPYYQEQMKIRYNMRPGWLGPAVKPTYVLAATTLCQSAGAPKPVHVILNSVRHDNPKEPFRFATPPEKRIELYYAVAAGAKAISYWWYCPYDEFYGVGGTGPEAAALWTEIGLLGAEIRTAGPVLTRSCPADISVKASRHLWVRSLLAGRDALVLLVVNDNHANDRVGTVIFPAENASVAVTCPAWLKPRTVFEVTCDGIRDVDWKAADRHVTIALVKVAVTRFLILSANESLRGELEQRYKTHFAARAAKLRSKRN